MAHNDVTNTNFDPTDVQLVVGTENPVKEFAGLDGWKTYHEVTLNRGPGGRAYGFNRQKGNNGVTFRIKVKATSPSLPYLLGLVQSQAAVAIKASIVHNTDLYQEGQIMALGCESGVLSGGDTSLGSDEEAPDVEFEVTGIGPIYESKAAPGAG